MRTQHAGSQGYGPIDLPMEWGIAEETFMNCKRPLLVFAAFIVLSSIAHAQQSVCPPALKQTTNQDVIKLVQAGIDQTVIMQQIAATCTTFDLSPDGLIDLKKNGVSADVISFMQAKMAGYSSPAYQQATQTSQPLPTPERAEGMNIWHGLMLDVATPEDAIAKLSQPTEDKQNQRLELMTVSRRFRLTSETRDKVYRVLLYKGLDDVKGARLYFRDGKLMLIHVDVKPIDPVDLDSMYGAQFNATEEVNDMRRVETEDKYGARPLGYSGMWGGALAGLSKRGMEYHMWLQGHISYVWANVERDSLKEMVNTKGHKGILPGWVTQVEFVSGKFFSDTTKGLQ